MNEDDREPVEADIFSEDEAADDDEEDEESEGEEEEEVEFDADEEFIIQQEEIEAQKQGAHYPKLNFVEIKNHSMPPSIPSKMPPKPNIIPERNEFGRSFICKTCVQ